MKPGEVIVADGDLILNAGAVAITLEVANTGDRPVRVGSHFYFSETNAAEDILHDMGAFSIIASDVISRNTRSTRRLRMEFPRMSDRSIWESGRIW